MRYGSQPAEPDLCIEPVCLHLDVRNCADYPRPCAQYAEATIAGAAAGRQADWHLGAMAGGVQSATTKRWW